MTPLERITERVTRAGHPDAEDVPTYLLSIEEFFEGNDVGGSIGCNLSPIPAPSHFYELFKRISRHPGVSDIRVQITMFDDPAWPFSDTVYVITSASPDEVSSWFNEDLKPDDMWEGFDPQQRYEPCEVPAGMRAVGCWWD